LFCAKEERVTQQLRVKQKQVEIIFLMVNILMSKNEDTKVQYPGNVNAKNETCLKPFVEPHRI